MDEYILNGKSSTGFCSLYTLEDWSPCSWLWQARRDELVAIVILSTAKDLMPGARDPSLCPYSLLGDVVIEQYWPESDLQCGP